MKQRVKSTWINKTLERLRTETPEERFKRKAAEAEKRETWLSDHYTVGYQLGNYIGEHIVARYLPTLSCDMMHSRNVIQVSEEETAEYNRLNDLWFDKVKHKDDKGLGKVEWNEMQSYYKKIQDKYMPHVLECNIHLLRVPEEMLYDVKKGIERVLWDCDMCSYHCSPNDIQITEDDWWTVLRFPLDQTPHFQELDEQ